jgi:hypothetical protein
VLDSLESETDSWARAGVTLVSATVASVVLLAALVERLTTLLVAGPVDTATVFAVGSVDTAVAFAVGPVDTAVAFAESVYQTFAAVDYGTVLPQALGRVLRISVLIAVGVFLANVAVAFKVVERVAGVSRYLTGPANLPEEVGTAILTTAASTTAGYGMLADFRDPGRLSDRATLVAVTINTFFGFVQHVFTFYVPVLIPILGREVGVVYVATRGGIALAITLTGVLAGALLLSERDVETSATSDSEEPPADDTERSGESSDTAESGDTAGSSDTMKSGDTAKSGNTAEPVSDGGRAVETPSRREALSEAWESTRGKLRRIVPRLAVVYVVVTVLAAAEVFRSLSAAAGPLAEVAGLPAAAVPVIVVFAFDTTAGAATVAPLIGGSLTPNQAIVTMLLGGIVTFAVSTFKRSIPFQYGIWGASFGSKVIAVNTTLKVVFISAAVVWFL